ncbi:hypothetical protein HDZ31DRAFT_82289 [Schizophyllum fasciatum]
MLVGMSAVTPTLADDQQPAPARVVSGAPPWMSAHPGATMMPPTTVSVFHPTPTPSLGKRERDDGDETDTQRRKREKAAERQRRKRQRDREGRDEDAPPGMTAQAQALDDEEAAKRERVRAAARERQRRHRMAVKQRKLQEMGLDMDPAAEEQYGAYPPQPPPPPPPHQPRQVVPPNSVLGGQTFATTLLLSFSCVPLLKQHLLRTLHMTNEELASLEPVIAQAFDHWDRQRRMAFQAIHGVAMPPPSAFAPPLGTITAPEILPPPPHPPYGPDPNQPSGSGQGSPDSREVLREQLQRVFQGNPPFTIPAPAPPAPPPPQENGPPPQPSNIDPNLSENKPPETA